MEPTLHIHVRTYVFMLAYQQSAHTCVTPAMDTSRNTSLYKAKEFIKDALSLMTGILVVLILVFELIMPFIITLMVPGVSEEVFSLAVSFSRITFPFILLISLTALFSGVLNTHDRFGAAASSQIAGNIFIIFIMKIVDPSLISDGTGVAVAIMGSGFVQLLWVYIPCYLMGIRPSFRKPRKNQAMRNFGKRMIPAAVGSGVLQINLFIDTIIASLLPMGTISYLYYADRLYHLPISITGTALGTVLLPMLSKQWRENNVEGAMHNQNRAIEFAMLITLPAMVGLIYLSYPLVMVIFERGAFDHASTIATAETLAGFATGLPAYILIKIFNTSFFARQDTVTPIKVALAGMVVNVVLNFALIYKYKHLGIAIATSSASWFNAAVLVYLLKKRKFINFDAALWKFLSKILIPCGLIFLVLFVMKPIVASYLISSDGIHIRAIALSVLVGSSLLAYFVAAWATGLLKFKEYMSA